VDKKKITFFCAIWQMGGVEKVVINLANGLFAKSYAVDICCLDIQESSSLLPKLSDGINLINLNTKRVRNSFKATYKYLSDNKPDIVFSNFNYITVVILVVSLFVRSNTKYIAIEHSPTPFTNRKKFVVFSLSILMFLTYWRLSKIITVSEGVAHSVAKRVPYAKKKIAVIYNPVFSEDILNKKYEKVEEYIINQWIRDKKPIITSVGRFTFVKDYPTLIRAFDLVRHKGYDAKLILIGDGVDKELIEKEVENLGISRYVFMPGFKDNPYKYIRNSSVFVLSSKNEGFPTVLIEALACGVPVVSTDCISGPREILDNGKYGKLVPVGDAEKMAKAIIETLEDEYTSNIGVKRAEEFSIDKALSKYEEVIHSCLKI